MDSFWKVTGIIFITLILGMTLEKTEKDFSVLLRVSACCMASVVAITYLMPILNVLRKAVAVGNLQSDGWTILLKATGISLVCETAGHVCIDAGNSSLAKMLHLLGSAVIASLSIPVLDAFLTLVQELLSSV